MSFWNIEQPEGRSSVMWEVQRGLSRAQAIPLIGPLVVSPLKAAVSLVQFVVGFFFSVICGSLCVMGVLSERLATSTFTALKHTGLGFIGLGYSLMNIFTLGILSMKVEGGILAFNHEAEQF